MLYYNQEEEREENKTMNTYEVTIYNYSHEVIVYVIKDATCEQHATDRAMRAYRFGGFCSPINKDRTKVRKI